MTDYFPERLDSGWVAYEGPPDNKSLWEKIKLWLFGLLFVAIVMAIASSCVVCVFTECDDVNEPQYQEDPRFPVH
jgi:hypothetical protein